MMASSKNMQPFSERLGCHGGVFAQRGHSGHNTRTAPTIMLFILGTPLKTTHLKKHA